MLLQQRILFLGSQVREFYPSFPSFSSPSLLLLFFSSLSLSAEETNSWQCCCFFVGLFLVH